MKKGILLVMLVLVVSLLSFAGDVKNVIFLIGDGMGPNEMLLSSYLEGRELYMMQMPYSGYAITYSADSNVTDSAAAGTALASGYKTDNGFIGMLPEGEVVPTIAEVLAEQGYKTGVIATSRITHATPAAYYGHTNDRDAEQVLAEQLVNSNLTVVLGGGWRYFDPTQRADRKDLISVAKENGFDYITTKQELWAYSGEKVLGLFSSSHMNSVTERTPAEPLLPEMTAKAIEILSKDDAPFFLMVEGSQIDWEGHDNDVFGVWKEMVEFDEAVKVALDFAKENPDTLVVVTADHETGGLGLSTGGYTMDLEMVRKYQKTTDWVIANSKNMEELKSNVKEYYGFELSEEEVAYLEAAGNKIEALSEITSARASIGWTTHDHTGALVPVFAFGPGAERFVGIMDNTDLPRKIASLLGVELSYPLVNVPNN
ncbi:alkaline phosphatase [Petrotoga olearia]|uniref:Alkaline phosphatase n=2 Tax=Petrotoga olearia TaxID=156203 RepID=A0A2K1NZH7_9BACT|nr:alkaline phosphatase [Petrotoga olearia]PNR95877.1 alkaline phosphatase [Petrotoga olearia DSM 13574]RMA68771.1 alkaline phosphatase [Petrotoga olearia]